MTRNVNIRADDVDVVLSVEAVRDGVRLWQRSEDEESSVVVSCLLDNGGARNLGLALLRAAEASVADRKKNENAPDRGEAVRGAGSREAGE